MFFAFKVFLLNLHAFNKVHIAFGHNDKIKKVKILDILI